MRFIVDREDILKIKYCPYCRSKNVWVYEGDFYGIVQCLNCDEELNFIILEEYRDRYPESFNKLIGMKK